MLSPFKSKHCSALISVGAVQSFRLDQKRAFDRHARNLTIFRFSISSTHDAHRLLGRGGGGYAFLPPPASPPTRGHASSPVGAFATRAVPGLGRRRGLHPGHDCGPCCSGAVHCSSRGRPRCGSRGRAALAAGWPVGPWGAPAPPLRPRPRQADRAKLPRHPSHLHPSRSFVRVTPIRVTLIRAVPLSESPSSESPSSESPPS